MPIYEAAGSLICQFGHGDIQIVTARTAEQERENEIVFVRQAAQPIGEPGESVGGKLSSETDAPVRLIFDNVESLDVLADMLGVLRRKMVGVPVAYPSGNPAPAGGVIYEIRDGMLLRRLVDADKAKEDKPT